MTSRASIDRRDALASLGLAILFVAAMLALRGRAGIAGGLALIAMLPFVRRAALMIGPPRLPWLAVPLAHLPIAMLCALGQAVIAFALERALGFGTGSSLIAHVRAGLIAYAIALLILLLMRRSRP